MMRIAKTMVTTTNDVDTWAKPIEEKQADVDRLIALAEAERAQAMAEDIVNLRTGQIVQTQKLSKTYEALQKLSVDMVGPISRINKQLSSIEDDLERKMRSAILESISGIKYIVQHKLANSGLVENSGQWFLNQPRFRQWRDESCSSVLWLHGIPGSGKTKLTSMVVSEIKKSNHVAFFYAVRNPVEPERSECDQILRSLLRQLASPSPGGPIFAPIVSRYEDALSGLEDYTDVIWTYEDAVETLIELCNLYPAVVFIIDALDEVNPMNRLDLLDALIRVMEESETLVKIFISSRENMDVFDRLDSKPNVRIGAKDNAEDIAKFVQRQLKIANLLQGKLPVSLKQKIPEVLIEGAQGMFRWVDLQIQSLRPLKVAADIDDRLGRLPQTLEESYFEMFEQIASSGEHAFGLAIFTFQWLLYAQRPIAISDFALLASIQLNPKLQHTAQNVLDVCQNLVVSNDAGIFRFAHLSVREFLENLKEGRLKHRDIGYFSPDEGHAAIASTSLTYLKTIMSLDLTQMTDLLVTTQLTKNPVIKSYAVNYWPFHVSKSGQLKYSTPLATQVRSFLVKNNAVASTFADWCTLVRNENSLALPDIIKAAQLPPNPIFLVHAYDILDIKHVSISDKDNQRQAFVYAAGEGNCKVMSALLDQGVDIKDAGIMAMERAIAADQPDAVELLIRLHVPIASAFLLQAATSRRSGMVRVIITHKAKDFSAAQLTLAFRIVIANGDVDLLPTFLNAGITRDPVAVVRALKAATPISAMHLINAGFDIDSVHLLEKRAALHWAVERGFTSIVQVLLDKNVHTDTADAWGNTPLHLAAWRNRSDIARMLLERKVDENHLNHAGQTPLHLASMMGSSDVFQILQHSTDQMHLKDNLGQSPLEYAESYVGKRYDDAVPTVIGGPKPSNVRTYEPTDVSTAMSNDIESSEASSVANYVPSNIQQDYADEDIFDPNFFKKSTTVTDSVNTQTAQDVLRDWEDRYNGAQVTQAEFFAPKELLQDDSLPKYKANDDVNPSHSMVPPYPAAYAFVATRDDKSTVDQPWLVPTLNLIAPTPPGSRSSSVRSASVPPSPNIEPIEENEAQRPDEAKQAKSRVSWGENQFHHFEVATPDSYRTVIDFRSQE
jgi:ankyrin repeat protein